MIKTPEKHPDVIAYRAAEKDLSNDSTTLAKKKEALNAATQRFMGQKTASRSKIDREADEILTGMGHATGWISAEMIEELSREVEVWERIVQRRRDTVGKLRTRYSAAICQQEDVQERYIEIQRHGVRACAELAAYNAEEAEFFNEINAVGLASDPNSVATFHRKEVEQYCPQALA